MNHRSTKLLSILAVTLLVSASSAQAQNPYGQGNRYSPRPTTSPYLNLFNNRGSGGGNFGLNYYQQVRPQQEFRSNIQRNQRDLQAIRNTPANSPANAQNTAQAPTSQLNTTGHTTSFLSTGSYFPGIGRR